MDRSQEIQELLTLLAANLKEQDLAENPELVEQLSSILEALDPSNKLDPAVIQQLAQIPDKQQRFLTAIEILKVQPEAGAMAKLVEAMQDAGLLNRGIVNTPGEHPRDPGLPEGHAELPITEPEDDFDPGSQELAEDVDIDDRDVVAAGSHRW